MVSIQLAKVAVCLSGFRGSWTIPDIEEHLKNILGKDKGRHKIIIAITISALVIMIIIYNSNNNIN